MRTLLIAPYVGEIGWELMSWQGRVRLLFGQGRFDRLVVLGAPSKSAFYADMPLAYRVADLRGVPGAAYEDRRAIPPANEPLPAEAIRTILGSIVQQTSAELHEEGDDVEVLWPEYSGTVYPCESTHQAFIRFEQPCDNVYPAPWVVLVQRNRSFGAENWQAEQWSLLEQLLQERGVHTSVYPQESQAAIAAASHCDLAVGQSTGGLHLASLCGCPQVVWSPGEHRIWTKWEITNRQRYETFWNPLGTPVRFHDTSGQPEPAKVADWVLHALTAIGRRTGSSRAKAAFRTRWHMKNWLVRRVVRRDSFRQWPWPAQQYVKYQLI